MRAHEFITEGLNHPIIVVDVQPEYAYYGNNANTCENIVKFVTAQKSQVLMFVNAEDSGVSVDTRETINQYWEDVANEYNNEEDRYDYDEEYIDHESIIDWNRFTIVDKGFGYLRGWMDQGVSDKSIIKTIRAMYMQKVSDSRMLYNGEDSESYYEDMTTLLGREYTERLRSDAISVEWISVAQLKRFNGAYLVGGGRDECLKEVTLLMSAFNIKYKLIDRLVY
jgi:hypothetical protein